LDIGVLGYIGIVQHKEHPPEVFHIPPGTPCIAAIIHFWHCTCLIDILISTISLYWRLPEDVNLSPQYVEAVMFIDNL